MTYIIAEIGINHNGDMKLAKQLMRTAAKAGCNAVKFQKRTIEDVYTKEELDAYRESPWGTTNREQKNGLEFSMAEYVILEEYAKKYDLDFIVSCWDIKSLSEVETNLKVRYHKVASALATDTEFLKKLNETGKPIILSVGMMTEEEIDSAVNALDNIEYILACTSTYPTKPEEVNLNHIITLKSKYNTSIGFSNHYNGLDACVGATALGAKCIEFHITKDRAMYGSDQPASIENIDDMVKAIKSMELMLGDGNKVVYETEKPIAAKLRKVNDICN